MNDRRIVLIATTQPTAQNNSKQLGWSGIIIGKVHNLKQMQMKDELKNNSTQNN